MFQEAKCSKEQDVLRSKVCQGVKCVEKESELGCKVYYATLKQSVPKEQSVLGSKVWVSQRVFWKKQIPRMGSYIKMNSFRNNLNPHVLKICLI